MIKEIKALEVKSMLEKDEAIIIDVREPQEFSQERIKEAINIPLSLINEEVIKQISGDKKLIIQCLSGARANNACSKIHSLQNENTVILKEGINAWKKEGLPTIKKGFGMSIFRQVLIVAGSLIILSNVLAMSFSTTWYLLSGFVGLGLTFAGITGICAMANILQKMPWNK